MDDIKFMTGYNVEPVVASDTAVAEAITRYYPAHAPAPRIVEKKEKKEKKPVPAAQAANLNNAATLEMVTRALEETTSAIIDDDDVELLEEIEQIDVSSLEKQGGEAPVIRLVNLMLMSAIQKGASDIHVEPYEKEFRVRFRIDGILYNVMAPPMKFRDAITSRLKIMAKLDIAEKRLPQDGRIKIRFGDADGGTKEIDFRVSILPTLFGEKIVMRLLDKDKLMLDMTKLGFESDSLRKLETAIGKPWGMVLVTGPTGSGKTNTLYSSIAKINTAETNIMTAEDPVEFNLVGVNQVQVKENIGLNFAAALRSFLRQDPNIILVGEIRDFETAEIAVKASLTGHLVLSTLHTNDAPSTISRLMNMGIEPFLVASSVNLICAQRLVRRLCTQCKTEHPHPPQALVDAGFTPEEAQKVVPQKGAGCERCNNTGYKGRVGLYEVMEVSEELRELILVGASALELRRKAIDEGMITLRRSGLHKVMEGVTTIEEVARETVK
jgi:type IV pilus assembly protein PilB